MEIKFNVWYKQDRQMIDWFTLTQSAWNTYRCEQRLSLIYDVLVAKKDDFEVLLFTGRKDKNNKELYRGDILKISKRLSREFVKPVLFESIKAIVWDSPFSEIKLETEIETNYVHNGSNHYKYANAEEENRNNVFYLSQVEDFEIEKIGNIYENYELIMDLKQ